MTLLAIHEKSGLRKALTWRQAVPMNLEELCAEAALLSPVERGRLVGHLLSDVGSSGYDVTDKEVASRVAETSSGQVQDISFEQLLSGLEHPKAS